MAMSKQRKQSLIDATYLDRLGTESARTSASSIRRQAQERGVALPLDDSCMGELLDHALEGLQSKNRIDWPHTPDLRRQVFIEAWIAEMTRQGVRA
jgi:hypothetical protein